MNKKVRSTLGLRVDQALSVKRWPIRRNNIQMTLEGGSRDLGKKQ